MVCWTKTAFTTSAGGRVDSGGTSGVQPWARNSNSPPKPEEDPEDGESEGDDTEDGVPVLEGWWRWKRHKRWSGVGGGGERVTG